MDKAQCSATCSSFFHATWWLIASSLSFIRRHLVSDREKPLNTLSIHTFHPGLPGRPRRYSWPLIRSAFCNYSTHLLSGVRGVQLVQALLAPPLSLLGPCVIFILRHFPRPPSFPLFRVFVLYTIIATFYLPTILNGPVFGFGPTARERGPRRDRSLLWSARSFCKDVKTVPRDKRSSTIKPLFLFLFNEKNIPFKENDKTQFSNTKGN